MVCERGRGKIGENLRRRVVNKEEFWWKNGRIEWASSDSKGTKKLKFNKIYQ